MIKSGYNFIAIQILLNLQKENLRQYAGCPSPCLQFAVKQKLLKFDIMQVQVDIGFDQLVQLAKRLPTTQWAKLKQEVEAQAPADKEREDFRKLLLNGPTFSKKQLDAVAETRKRIDEWRTK